jgi:hypothetical protein
MDNNNTTNIDIECTTITEHKMFEAPFKIIHRYNQYYIHSENFLVMSSNFSWSAAMHYPDRIHRPRNIVLFAIYKSHMQMMQEFLYTKMGSLL